MKKVFSLRFIAHLLICSASIPMLGGCAEKADVAEGVGIVSLPLTATSSSGTRYRLVGGTFDLSGPVTATLWGDAEAGATLIRESVPVGAYSIAIRSGWQVQRESSGGALTAIDATLVSPATQSLQVSDGATAEVTYLFDVGDEVIEFGNGRLEVTFAVETSAGCSSPEVECGGACVDISRDSANCGACGAACPASTTCELGTCVVTPPMCTGGLVSCSGACVDVASDEANCGGCGLVCPASTTCQSGTCTPNGGTDQVFPIPLIDAPVVPTPMGPGQWVEFTAVNDCPGCLDGVGPFSSNPPGPGWCMAGSTTSGDFGDLSLIGLVSPIQQPLLPPTFTGLELNLVGNAPDVRLVVSDGGSSSRTAEVDLGALNGGLNRTVDASEFRCMVGMPPENCLADLGQATAIFLLVPGGLVTAPFNFCANQIAFHF